MQGHIYIHGTIGSYTNPQGVDVKGVELLDVIAQVKSQPKANSFLVHIGSPGGLVDAGDQIYDYLQSLKTSGINVDTISDNYTDSETGELKSGVGSIATKIFLAGTNRSIIEGHEFFIHNPWTQPQAGDSVKIKVELKALEQKETELRTFYQQHTNIDSTGLKGLMDNETGMNADQAVTLGFATRKVSAQKIKAFAQLNDNNMSKENQTIAQQISDLTKTVKEFFGNKPLAELPGAAPGEQAPGGDPNTLPDGEYPLADGRVLVISGGQIQEVKMPAAAAAPTALPAAAAAGPTQAELQAKIDAQAKEIEAMKAQNADTAKAFEEFKATLVSGKTPAKAFNNNGGNSAPVSQNRSIAKVQAQQRDERKKQLHKN